MKFRRNRFLLPVVFIAFIMGSNRLRRFIFWKLANTSNQRKFSSLLVRKGAEQFSFIRGPKEWQPELPIDYRGVAASTLDEFLSGMHTTAFLAIQNDTILTERYYNGNSRRSVVPVFSVVKSLVSALTGIALDEGLIRSVDQPVTDFLSGFRHQGFNRVTIRHLLEMRSGIRFTESYFNPFSDVARYYYGASLDKLVYNARIKEPPGKRYDYASVNAQILGMVLEKVSGKFLSQYLEDKIWSRIGMEYDASWNVDSRKNGRIRAFCCLNAAPADMARFARLYLRKGEWGSEQILSREWIRESIRIANDSRDDQGYPYHHFWRVLEDGSYFAKGMLGQYIYIDPSRELIICRFGKQEGDIDWVRFFRELSAGL